MSHRDDANWRGAPRTIEVNGSAATEWMEVTQPASHSEG